MKIFEPTSEMLQRDVIDSRGNLVGSVDELLIDPKAGRIEYVRIVLETDGSPKDHYIVVPWSAMSRDDRARTSWRVMASRSVLESLAHSRVSSSKPKPAQATRGSNE